MLVSARTHNPDRLLRAHSIRKGGAVASTGLGMRILLQNVRNKLFFRAGDVWTSNPNAAFDFQQAHAVYDFVSDHQLEDVQLVVNFASPLQYEVVPIERASR
jgi:hypothetical protein